MKDTTVRDPLTEDTEDKGQTNQENPEGTQEENSEGEELAPKKEASDETDEDEEGNEDEDDEVDNDAIVRTRVVFEEVDEEDVEAPGLVTEASIWDAAVLQMERVIGKMRDSVEVTKADFVNAKIGNLPIGKAVKQINPFCLSININMLAQIKGIAPIILEGAVFQVLPSSKATVFTKGGTKKVISFEKGANADLRPITGAPLRFKPEADKDDVVQDLRLIVLKTAGNDGRFRPQYFIRCPSEAGMPPFVVPIALWHYKDTGDYRIEADRNFSIKITDFGKSNFDKKIGIVLRLLLDTKFPVAESTLRPFATREEHDEYRRKMTTNAQNNNNNNNPRNNNANAEGGLSAPSQKRRAIQDVAALADAVR